jgi:parallel beta-helix repeat protein
MTKAAQTVQTPDAGNRHRIHWGPGTYREKISFSYAGRSVTENITYEPDPNCLWLTNDKPGRCRITGCDSNEIASSGDLVKWNNKNYVTFGCDEAECFADGVKGTAMYATSGGLGRNCVRVNAQGGSYGFSSCTATNCTAQGGNLGFNSCTATNCTAQGGYYGFSYCTATNCTAQGNNYGFYYCTATNCTAQGGYYGFRGTTSDKGVVYDCTAASCNTNAYGALGGDAKVTEGAVAVGRIGQMPYMPLGVRQKGTTAIVDTLDSVRSGAALALSAERLIAFTPNSACTSKSVMIYVESLAASGNITCELQKYVDGSWATQRSKTLAKSALIAVAWNRFVWDTGDGDDHLTAVAGTWRYRVTADADAQTSTIRTSNGTSVSYIGYAVPDEYDPYDIDGRPRAVSFGGKPSIGCWEPPDMTEEWTTYKTTAPAIKLTGNSMHIMKVAAAKNKAITVKWWVRHHGTASDKKPQIWLKGPGLSTQTATCTAAADTWEQVSVSITPTRDTVLDVCLYSRDPATGAYAIFSDPEVS